MGVKSQAQEQLARHLLMADLHRLNMNGSVVRPLRPEVDDHGVDLVLATWAGQFVPVQLKSKRANARTSAWQVSTGLMYPRPTEWSTEAFRRGSITGLSSGGAGGAVIVQVLEPLHEWPFFRPWYQVGTFATARALLTEKEFYRFYSQFDDGAGLRLSESVSWNSGRLTPPVGIEDALSVLRICDGEWSRAVHMMGNTDRDVRLLGRQQFGELCVRHETAHRKWRTVTR